MQTTNTRLSRSAFTLIELLVVIAILGILAALLFPALTSAKQKARGAVCLSNLKQVGIGIICYAPDNNGRIPYGPKAPPMASPANFYPSTGAPTSLISLNIGSPVALGLLLRTYIGTHPKILFCPGTDQGLDADAELAKVGMYQAQSSYFYRHGGNTFLNDLSLAANAPHLKLDDLGANRNGAPVRALALDTQFLCPPELAVYLVKPKTHHRQRLVNVLFADGHVRNRPNKDKRFTVDLNNPGEITQSFDKILKVLERADTEH